MDTITVVGDADGRGFRASTTLSVRGNSPESALVNLLAALLRAAAPTETGEHPSQDHGTARQAGTPVLFSEAPQA
jgi:hypothetical protein